MEEMPVEMENDLHCKAILCLMHLLNLEQITFNHDDIKAAGKGEDFLNFWMSVDTVKNTLTLRLEQVLD
jgi:hypothetical protein